MGSPSYRPVWEKEYQANRGSFIQVAHWDPFKDWDLDTAPDKGVEYNLSDGLRILYGHGDADLARRFLEHCLAIAERTLAEDTLVSPRCRDRFPENRGILIRARTYARGLLGCPLEETALRKASADFEQACATFPKHKWDDFQENTYLAVVRLALVASDGARAQQLLTRRRRFRWFPEQDEILRGLASALLATSLPDDRFRAYFKAYFDQVRDPAFNPAVYTRVPLLRLELGILYDKYLVSPNQTVDWQRTIDAIAE